jgi:hypothetical protein
VERFLLDGYAPQQLSTYALTLYRYVDVNVNLYVDGYVTFDVAGTGPRLVPGKS